MAEEMENAENLNSTLITHFYGDCMGSGERMRPKLALEGLSFMESLKKRVRFYFAAEDEICEDYVSEDFFRALNHSYVPVVLGGQAVGYDEVGLAGTYVDALDFEDVEALVEYLKELQASYNDYLLYLTWQHDYRIKLANDWVCSLKTALEEDKDKTAAVTDFRRFWHQKKCYGSYENARIKL